MTNTDSHWERPWYKVLFLLLILSLIGLGLVDLFTFRYKPGGHLSGNGNPALLIVIIWSPVYAALMLGLAIMSGRMFLVRLRQARYSIGDVEPIYEHGLSERIYIHHGDGRGYFNWLYRCVGPFRL